LVYLDKMKIVEELKERAKIERGTLEKIDAVKMAKLRAKKMLEESKKEGFVKL